MQQKNVTFVAVMAIKRYRTKHNLTSIISSILPAIVTLITAAACSHDHSNTSGDNVATMRSLFSEAKTASMRKDFRKSDSLGGVLLHLADISDNDEYLSSMPA